MYLFKYTIWQQLNWYYSYQAVLHTCTFIQPHCERKDTFAISLDADCMYLMGGEL